MTIKDIARQCGVSVSTVSRVLNDRPDVSPENRRKVLSAIQRSNYIPNNTARDLVKTKSDAIGLVVRGVSNPFYTDIIRVIEEQVTARGYTLVILLGGRSDYTPQELAPLNIPYVCCSYDNQYGTLPPDSYASVSIADEEEACRAVTELYRCGHRRIAALVSGTEDRSISQLRYQGYVRALAAHGLPLEQELVIEAGSFDIRQSYLAMQRRLLAGAQFTALFAISDNMAIGAMRALREAGRRIPEDCSVIAIDGLTVSDYINPTLTTLCQPMEHMGRRSVEILLDMVEHRGGPIRETAHTTLRTGESVRDIS